MTGNVDFLPEENDGSAVLVEVSMAAGKVVYGKCRLSGEAGIMGGGVQYSRSALFADRSVVEVLMVAWFLLFFLFFAVGFSVSLLSSLSGICTVYGRTARRISTPSMIAPVSEEAGAWLLAGSADPPLLLLLLAVLDVL